MDPPPLEDFRRLMESLGPESMFEEDVFYDENYERIEGRPEAVEQDLFEELDWSEEEQYVLPYKYEGGDPKKSFKKAVSSGKSREINLQLGESTLLDEDVSEGEVLDQDEVEGSYEDELDWDLYAHEEPSPCRVLIVSVVTNSTQNSTALEYVQKVYDYLREGTNHDKRIHYQTICLAYDNGQVIAKLFQTVTEVLLPAIIIYTDELNCFYYSL